jgi:hypothetical protein
MKIAKASYAEWNNLMDFANAYEELTNQWRSEPSDAELGQLLKRYNPQFFRTVFGYATLVDNFCNPKESTLAVAPEIEEIFIKTGFELKGGNFYKEDKVNE